MYYNTPFMVYSPTVRGVFLKGLYMEKEQINKRQRNNYIVEENYIKIIINSKKYGDKFCLIDKEDFEKIYFIKWSLRFDGYNFYASAKMNNKTLNMHREILGNPKNLEIDHINHNTLDNRKCNLRACTHLENMGNKLVQKNSSTGISGINKCKGKYSLRYNKNNQRIYLGVFNTIEEAKNYLDAYKKGEKCK